MNNQSNGSTSATTSISAERLAELKASLKAAQNGEKSWQQPVIHSADSNIGKSMKKGMEVLQNAAHKEHCADHGIDFVDVHEDAKSWTLSEFMDCFMLALSPVPSNRPANARERIAARRGAGAKKAQLASGSKGKDADDTTLEIFNRIDWKLKMSAVSLIVNPSMDADIAEEIENLIDEVGPRLAFHMSHCDSVGGIITQSGKRSMVKGVKAAIQASHEVLGIELAMIQAEIRRRNFGPMKDNNRRLVSPAAIEEILKKGTWESEDADRKARMTKGEKLGLKGADLEGFADNLKLRNGKWNLPERALLKLDENEMFDQIGYDIDSIKDSAGKAKKARSYKAWLLENKFIELSEYMQEVAEDLEVFFIEALKMNAKKIAIRACSMVEASYKKPAAWDRVLPEAVEKLFLDKCFNGFVRKTDDNMLAALDFESGNNLSGFNEDRKEDLNSSEYFEIKAQQFEEAAVQIDNRLQEIEYYEMVQGNAGVLGVDGQLNENYEDDGEDFTV